MLYIALALILVGILCFIYVSFQPGTKKDPGGSGQARPNSFSGREKKISQDALAALRKPGQSEGRNRLEHAFAEERKIPSLSERRTLEQEEADPDEEFREEIVTEPWKPEVEKPEMIERNEDVLPEIKTREEEWSLDGILFLDLSGRLPYESLKQKVRPESLKGFRRMGQGRIREIPGGFSFLARNSEFSYKLDEVEKIIFYDEGFALLPLKREYPTPVFLTKETEKFKSYLEQASGER